MKICVIIPMHNFEEHTNRCIDLTRKYAGVDVGDVDIIVVDDASKVPFKCDKIGVNVIRLNKNVGYTNATNAGIMWCSDRYDYLHFLNNDTEPFPNFIKYLLDAFVKDPEIGIACSAREFGHNGTKAIDNYPIDLLSGTHCISNQDLDNDLIYCLWVPICSALVKAETVRQVGLLDRRMRTYCSDNDFCVRAGIMGYKTALVPKSKVYHHGSVTTKSVGSDPHNDQKILITKIRSDYMRQALEQFPLDAHEKVMGRLTFDSYVKDANGSS